MEAREAVRLQGSTVEAKGQLCSYFLQVRGHSQAGQRRGAGAWRGKVSQSSLSGPASLPPSCSPEPRQRDFLLPYKVSVQMTPRGLEGPSSTHVGAWDSLHPERWV